MTAGGWVGITAGAACASRLAPMRQHCQQQQRDNIRNLDHRIDGRAGGVFVGVADGVAGHRSLVGV